MSVIEKLGVQFFEGCFCVCLVLMVYASLQQCVFISSCILIILFCCYQIIQERGSEQVSANGKWVLITGCDSGIGYEFALRAHSLGFNVIATCRNGDGEGAISLRVRSGGKVHVLHIDVTSDESVADCAKTVEGLIADKGLWTLVNNAGVMGFGDVEFLTMDLYKERLDVNFLGIVRVCKAFLPMVRKAKGRVVNVTSVRGLVAFPCNSAYVSSKFAAEGFTDCLRMEMTRFGVKVILVEPGNFGRATGIINKENDDRLHKEKHAMIFSASEEVLSAYGIAYLHNMLAGALKSTVTSHPNVDPVMKALTAAVAGVSPRSRYLVDGSNQILDIDCVMARLRPFVPVPLMDWLMMKVRPPPVVLAEIFK